MNLHCRSSLRRATRPRKLAASVALAMLSISAQAADARNTELQRAEQAVAAVRARMPASFSVGGGGTDLAIRNYMTNEQGRMIVRVNQTFSGYRVWGSSAVIHAETQGAPRIAADALAVDPVPAGSAQLTRSGRSRSP